MEQSIASAPTRFDALREHHQWAYTLLVLLFMFFAPLGLVNAQSKDKGKPTPITSNEISGLIEPSNAGDVYYYSIVAGPGDGVILLNLEATQDSMVSLGFVLSVGSKIIAGGGAIAHRGKRSAKQEVHVNLTQRQSLLLSIRLDSGSPGKYSFRFGGTLGVSKDKSETIAPGGTDFSEALSKPRRVLQLPKKGTLFIHLKDGSVKEIDLSTVEGAIIRLP